MKQIGESVHSLLDLLRIHAAESPDRPALHYFDWTASYAELQALSGSLARGLQDLGGHKGDRVAVFLQNEPAAVLAQYAIWMAGGIVVPLNIMFKEQELRYHLQDAGARGIVCQRCDAAWVRGVAHEAGVEFAITASPLPYLKDTHPLPEVIAACEPDPTDPKLDLEHLLQQFQGCRPDPVALKPEDIAYLHYTSGTTGPAKGAMISHGNILYNARIYRDLCDLSKEDCILATAPLFHITGTIGHIATACTVGAPLVLLHRFHPGEAIRQIQARQTTFTIGSITAFLALLGHPSFDRSKVASLCKVFSGGAPVSPAVAERWEGATGSYLHNVWGMTETTSPGTWTPIGCRAPVDPATNALSVGRALPGCELRVVAADSDRALGPGEVGELIVRGPNIFSGYWNKPAETAQALRDGWLYTGDLAKVDEAGWVYWIERKKDQINSSGFKVWPREVEDVLLQHPGVQEAAVIGVPDPYRGENVKAVVILKPGYRSHVAEPDLIAFTRERLANYKCPRTVEFRDELPKNPQGKLQKYLLKGDGKAGG